MFSSSYLPCAIDPLFTQIIIFFRLKAIISDYSTLPCIFKSTGLDQTTCERLQNMNFERGNKKTYIQSMISNRICGVE